MSSLNQGVHVTDCCKRPMNNFVPESWKLKLTEFYSCIKNMCEKAGVLKSQSVDKSDWLLNMCTTQNLESLSSGPPIFVPVKLQEKLLTTCINLILSLKQSKNWMAKRSFYNTDIHTITTLLLQYSTNFCYCLLLFLLFTVSEAFLIFSFIFCYCTLLGYRGITR